MIAKNRIYLLMCLGAVLTLTVAGCCSVGIGTCTRTDTISLDGSAQLNACGADNKSHPVILRFHYLSDTAKFNSSSFEDIWDDPVATLAGDMAGGYENVTLAPGERETVTLTRPEGATAIAMLINFCDESDINSRRYVFELDKKDLKKTVHLQGITFSVK